MNQRIEQLDSIRGLAAFVVFMCHLPLIPILKDELSISGNIALRASGLVNGHGSVILFFVLSGFVLSIPFFNKKEIDYTPYLIKRIFRIYTPYLVAITFAIILSQLFWNIKVDEIGKWPLWETPLNLNLIIEHIYLIGNIHSEPFNGVIWSLIHELRISLIFPFVLLLVNRLDWKLNVIVCCFLSEVSGLNNVFGFQVSNGYHITYFHTIHYLSIFILGALLAKHRTEILSFYYTKSVSIKCTFLIISFLMYNLSETLTGLIYRLTEYKIISVYSLMIVEYGMALGSLGILLTAIGSSKISKVLMKRPISFLGKISYSLYLYHLPVLKACIYLFHKILPIWVICVVAVPLVLIVSSLSWYCIENPSMKLGKGIANKIIGKRKNASKEFKKFA
ncbi:acyltransferase [Domibacillus sp. PGB-M46]|uniref:acyltransferase family protein n=1 Tax=Domibacillus sp. PGB-M46 TaxID=2910255 RepID=UPI001F5AF0FB|nr:acyltransferase [Domibacillus sp. PGB-M46]MCI2257061.1 acyltransferase [Domibacillus sp. PGB-M46]